MFAETIVTLIVSIFGLVAGSYIWEKCIRDRISVKQIKSLTDPDIPDLIRLYLELFPDSTKDYSAEYVRRLIEDSISPDPNKHVRCNDIVLLARYKKNVVGFLFCHFYPDRQKAIISYYGIDKTVLEARRGASDALLTRIYEKLSKSRCEYVFFDLECPDLKLIVNQKRERRARIELFKQTAKRFNLTAVEPEFIYKSPKIALEKEAREKRLCLLFVPLVSFPETKINKSQLIEFLRFVYFDCYGDIYSTNDHRFDQYRVGLNELISYYENSLPHEITIR